MEVKPPPGIPSALHPPGTKKTTGDDSGIGSAKPGEGIRVLLISAVFFLLHTLPMLWVIHCGTVLLWLFPLTNSLLWNLLLLVVSLVLFIVSGVNLKDF